MSVLIEGVKMPESCDSCWALDYSGDYPRCRITDEQRGYNFRVREKRMDKCPLVEIPTPHGRLIDADALTAAQQLSVIVVGERPYIDAKEVVQLIYGMPTIIEAEEGEGWSN